MTNDTHDLDEPADRLRAGDRSVIDELVRRGARDQLRQGLESEYDLIREEALSGLAQIRDPHDLPTMLEQLRAAGTEPPLGVIEALGAIGDERAAAPLKEVAASHPDETARQWAQDALERIAARI
jgi:HEAT repeat protein